MYDELIAALNRHSEALETFVGHVEGATGKAGGSKPAAGKANKPAAGKATGPKKPTLDTVKKEFSEYLGISDKAVRAERVAEVTAINEHFGVAKITEGDPEIFAEALHYLKLYKDGKVPTFSGLDDEGEEPGDDDEGGSLV